VLLLLLLRCSLCSAYSPRVSAVKESSPRVSFSRSSRFGGPFGSYQVLNNSATAGAVSGAGGRRARQVALVPGRDVSKAQPKVAAEQHQQQQQKQKQRSKETDKEKHMYTMLRINLYIMTSGTDHDQLNLVE
jgi:hypothetical protein